MKQTVVLLAFLVVLASPSLALPIVNLQDSTTCIIDNCTTVVDMPKIGLTGHQVTNVKAIDLKASLPKIASIKGMDVKIDGNLLYITGQITQNTYWTMDIGNYVTVDPWWNISTYAIWNASYSLGSTAACLVTDKFGIQLHPNASVPPPIGGVIVNSAVSPTFCEAWNQTGTITFMVNGTFTGKECTFSTPFQMRPNEWYFVVVGGKTSRVINGAASNITTGYGFNVTSGVFFDGSWHNDLKPNTVQPFDIQNITIIVSTTGYLYDTELFLNGNQSNLNIYNNQSVSIIGNVTGNTTGNWNLTLYANSTFLNSSLNNVTNVTNLTPGYWAITLRFHGNASVPEFNRTLYVNVSEVPNYGANKTTTWDIAALEPNYIICQDNTTLQKWYTDVGLIRNITCQYGCEDAACKNSPLWEGIILFGFIVGFVLFLVFLDKVILRGRR